MKTPPATATPDSSPRGTPLASADIATVAAMFTDNPLTGGQVAPRQYKWITEDVAMFIQFDKPRPAEATALRYVGVAVKGIFCAGTQPDRSFTHFDRLSAPAYGQGAPAPGEPGYWLTAMAVTSFVNEAGRQVTPGIDYNYAPTAPSSCPSNVAKATFAGPGARKLNAEEIAKLGAFFNNPILTGGQVAPRLYRWVNENVAVFLQFNAGNPSASAGFNPAAATALRYLGLAVKGEFCQSNQPSPDFPHFHRFDSPTYAEGHGGPPHTKGIWLLWVATDKFEVQGREVTPGVDRLQSLMPIEQSC